MAYNAATRTFDTIADLWLQRGTANVKIVVLGYYAPGDGGGGEFYWDATSVIADDGGSTINCSVGSGAGRWKRNFSETINVKEFGAVGTFNNSTGVGPDDTVFIQKAATYATSLGANKIGRKPTLYIDVSSSYKITDTITIGVGVNLNCLGYVNYAGTADRPAIVIGQAPIENQNIIVDVRVVYYGSFDWSNTNFIGIQLINTQRSKIRITYASRFTVGAEFVGDSGVGSADVGFTHNPDIVLGQFIDNKYGLSLRGKNGHGYCNENKYSGGNFQCTSVSPSTSSRYGIWMQAEGSSVNQNVFDKPSFELGWSIVSDQVNLQGDAVLIENTAGFNTFTLCRAENTSGTFLRINGGAATGNVLTFGLSASNGTHASLIDLSTQRGNYVLSADDRIGDFENDLIFDSGDLRTRINKYDSTRYFIKGLSFSRTNDAGIYAAGNCTPTTDYVSIGSEYMTMFIDTRFLDKITIKRDFDTGFGGRLLIACFDAAGVIIDPTTFTGLNSLITPTAQFAPSLQLGGSYVYGTDRTARQLTFYIKNETVKKIRLAVTSGTQPLRIRSFRIYANGGVTTSIWSGLGFDDGNARAAILPTEVKEKGSIIFNDLSSTASPFGWINTDGGTIWVPFIQPTKKYVSTSLASTIIDNTYLNTNHSEISIGGQVIFNNLSDAPSNVLVAEKMTLTTWYINYNANKAT